MDQMLFEQYKKYTTEALQDALDKPGYLTDEARAAAIAVLSDRQEVGSTAYVSNTTTNAESGATGVGVTSSTENRAVGVISQNNDLRELDIRKKSTSWIVTPLHLWMAFLVTCGALISVSSQSPVLHLFFAISAGVCGIYLSVAIVQYVCRKFPQPRAVLFGLLLLYPLVIGVVPIILYSHHSINLTGANLIWATAALIILAVSLSKNIRKSVLPTLTVAAGAGDIDLVKEVLKRGDNVNERDSSGGTALHYAVLNRQSDAVVILLERGADVNARTNRGLTPLGLAELKGFDDIRTILLSAATVVPPANGGCQNIVDQQDAARAEMTATRRQDLSLREVGLAQLSDLPAATPISPEECGVPHDSKAAALADVDPVAVHVPDPKYSQRAASAADKTIRKTSHLWGYWKIALAIVLLALPVTFFVVSSGHKSEPTLGAGQEPEQGFVATLKAAEQGSAKAQLQLAQMYYDGNGVTKDAAQAAAWYRKAAEQGDVEAQFWIGALYHLGEGVSKDTVQSVAWHRKAAEQGDAASQAMLGYRYRVGHGVPKDDAQAAAWYRKAAEQGDVEAQLQIGVMHYLGEGVPKDTGQAVAWYRKAAEQGYAAAQYSLGTMYYIGGGVPKDLVLAYAWYNLAAAQGEEKARQMRDTIERKLPSSKRQEAQRLTSKWEPGQDIRRD